jgi:hypothetical protein
LAISFLFAYMGTSLDEYTEYYLTENHKLIEVSLYNKIKIHDKDTVSEVEHSYDYFWPDLYEKKYVYELGLYRGILRINTSDYTSDILYKIPRGRHLSRYASKYDQTIALLEENKDLPGIQLVLIDELSKNVTRIPFNTDLLNNYYYPRIFGTDIIDTKRFWLISSRFRYNNLILRLWEDGSIENIGNSILFPLYVNRILISYTDKAMLIRKLTGRTFETMREIPEAKDIKFSIFPWNVSTAPVKEIYTQKFQKYYRLDLETFEFEELGEWKGYVRYFYPGINYFIKNDIPNKRTKLYLLKEGKLELLKSFKGYDSGNWKHSFTVFKSGVVIRKGSKVKVYAFPDFKELKFKGL